MARHTRFQHPLHLLRQHWPTHEEWQEYRVLSKQVLVVIVSFVLLCLMVAFAFELPLLLP
ncbi:MAG TPA: hypothetical protein VKP65_14940 [Rhodothermales bacterium]|nr:hypothetical protein [Rhodothermales bacterium]